jgi:hypothetical protein
MFWYEAIVKFYNESTGEFVTERLIAHAKDYPTAVEAIVKDYGKDLHSFLISETVEGDIATYACDGDAASRFNFLDDWSPDDLTRPR